MKRSSRLGWTTTALVLTVLTSACGSTTALRSGGPHPIETAPSEGLRYYVARDLLVANIVVTRVAEVKWARQSRAPVTSTGPAVQQSECGVGARQVTTTSKHDIVTVAVPDARYAFRLGFADTPTSKQDVKIGISPFGILTGLNYQARDKTAEILTNVIEGAARIAGSMLGPRGAADGTDTTTFIPTNEFCFLRTALGSGLKRIADSLQRDVDRRQAARISALQPGGRASSDAELVLLRAKDGLAEHAMTMVVNQVTSARAAFAGGAAAYAVSRGVGATIDSQVQRRYVFDLTSLPALATGTEPSVWPDTDPRRAMLDETNLILAVSDMPSARTTTMEPDPTVESVSCANLSRPRDCTRIFYRTPIPRLLTIFEHEPARRPFVKVREQRLLQVVSSADPILHLAFGSRRFGTNSYTIEFGPYGNPTSLVQSSEAVGERVAALPAQLLGATQTGAIAGIEGVEQVLQAATQSAAARRAAQLEDLKDQKKLIDAQVDLLGAEASGDLKAIQARLAAEIAVLTSQASIAGMGDTTQTGPIALELARVQQEKALVAAQLDLERARRTLDSLRLAKPTTGP